MTTPEELGAAVRRARQARGFTLRRLARASGMTESWLTRIEQGRGNPSIRTLCRVAGALGLPVSTILYDAEGRPFDDRTIIDADEFHRSQEDSRVQRFLANAEDYGERMEREGRFRW